MTKGYAHGSGYIAHVNIIKRGYNSPAIPIPIPLMRKSGVTFGMLGTLEWDGKDTFTFTLAKGLMQTRYEAEALNAAQRVGVDAERAENAAIDGIEPERREMNLIESIEATRVKSDDWKTADVPDEPDLGETFR